MAAVEILSLTEILAGTKEQNIALWTSNRQQLHLRKQSVKYIPRFKMP